MTDLKAHFNQLCLLALIVLASSCGDRDTEVAAISLESATSVKDKDGNTYNVGFDQTTSINQDAFVSKSDASGKQLWRLNYDKTPVDSRANFIALDAQGNPWVTFSVDGGSNSGDYINKLQAASNAFSGVWQSGYGSGGGPKVAIIAKLNPATGKIEKGSFVVARLTSGNTNTFNIMKFGIISGKPAFEASTAAWPPGKGSSYSRFPDITDADRTNGAFKMYFEMDVGLSSITEAKLLK